MRWLVAIAALGAILFALASSAAADPRVYVLSYGSGPPEVVAGFQRAANGSLVELTSSPFPLVSEVPAPVTGPKELAFAPEGDRALATFLYKGGAQGLSVAANGSASPAGSPIVTPSLTGGAVMPDGRFAYAPTREFEMVPAEGVLGFSIAPSGALAPLGAFGSGVFRDVAVTPDGRFLYAAVPNQIQGFAIGVDGKLTPLGPKAALIGTRQLAVSADGQLLFASVSGAGDGVASFSIGTDGGLAQNGEPALTGSTAMGYFAVSPDARHVYMPDGNVDGIVTAAVSATGTMNVIGTMPVEDPDSVAVSPDGRFLYYYQLKSPTGLGVGSIGSNGLPIPLPLVTPFDTAEAERIVFQPQPTPVASFTAAPGPPGSPSSFDASASSRAARYDWDFGDGTTLADGGPRPSHAYADAGVYRVSLTVTDEQGCSTGHIYTGQSTVCPGGRSPTATATLDVGAPVGSKLRLRPRRFRPARKRKPSVAGASAKRRKRSRRTSRVSYRLSENASVRFIVRRRTIGRKKGKRCVIGKRARRLRKAKKCKRFVRVKGAFTHTGKQGANRFRFSGYMRGRRLRPGAYRMVGVSTDAAGNRGRRFGGSFVVARR